MEIKPINLHYIKSNGFSTFLELAKKVIEYNKEYLEKGKHSYFWIDKRGNFKWEYIGPRINEERSCEE